MHRNILRDAPGKGFHRRPSGSTGTMTALRICFSLTPGLSQHRELPKRTRLPLHRGATSLQSRVAASPPPQQNEQPSRSLHPVLLAINRHVVDGAVSTIDALYPTHASPWRRLWLLEVIARVPYFTFLCVNHLAETLGLGSERVTERLRAHFAEADNEALHLAVMETLGGGELWVDKFIAQHVALVYFWVGIVAYLFSPALAYNFNELVELHAYKTYDKVLRENEFALRNETPIPLIARQYYTEDATPPRIIENMYDVIEAIRDDEANHATDLNRYSQESVGDVPWRG